MELPWSHSVCIFEVGFLAAPASGSSFNPGLSGVEGVELLPLQKPRGPSPRPAASPPIWAAAAS